MKTEDELIAEFIGATIDRVTSGGKKLWNFSNLPEFCKQIDISESRLRVFYADDLRFSISWDWLMPVVKKCEDISRQKQHDLDSPGKDLDDHNGWRAWSYHEPNLSTDLKSVYEQTVEFIRWYNSQNS